MKKHTEVVRMIREAGSMDEALEIFEQYVAPEPRGKSKPPTLEEVVEFARERAIEERESASYYISQAEKAFEFYENNMRVLGCRTWKDGNGNPVKNWKLKIMNNWLRDR